MSDVELTVGDASLAVDLVGGGLRALRVGGWEVLDGYPAGTVPHGRRGHVLAPWPNRVAGGRYTWGGQAYQLEITEPAKDSAIHGFVDRLDWTHTGGYQGEDRGEVGVGVAMEPRPGYPWPLRLDVRYLLTPTALEVVLSAQNLGDTAAPFGAGMHPYLALGTDADGTALDLPVTQRLPLDDHGAPAGDLVPFVGSVGRVGDAVLDVPLTGLMRDHEGWAHTTVSGPAGTLTVSVDQAWPWLQVFTADTLPAAERRRSVAVEPNTCPPDAFATGTDVVALEAGGTWRGAWRLSWKPA